MRQHRNRVNKTFLDAKQSVCHRPSMMQLHTIIRDRGYRQVWVAAQIGMTPSMFSRVLHGHRSFDEGKIPALAKVLKLTQREVREALGNGTTDTEG